MASVTQRIKKINQPRGGYINPKTFSVTQLNDKFELNPIENENISANLIGLAVDYLTRFMLFGSLVSAFEISIKGAEIVGEISNAKKLLKSINGLDDISIESSLKLVGYDVCFRAGTTYFKPVNEIAPNTETVENIRIMVNRNLKFFEEYGPVVKDGFTFAGAYTTLIDSGDGDYLTKDTLWDLKVSKDEPKSAYTLQLLIYYLMGCRSINSEFSSIEKIGLFNPRLNKVYQLRISDIDNSIISEVEKSVIGY